MSNNNLIKGVALVGLGATSYGMLATFVKLAYKENFTTAEVTVAQFVYGIIGILIIMLLQKPKNKKQEIQPTKKHLLQLMLAGTSLGLTSVFYYLCVNYINVSIAIVLLMQTVWMGVLLEWFLEKKAPSKQKIIAVLIVLLGTILATNILNSEIAIDWRGLVFGFLAAASFTTTMLTANKVAVGVNNAKRSLYMLIGGAFIIAIFTLISQHTPFNFEIFFKWGILVALFGTIIPPLLMNAGFPITGIGLGSIVSSLELPVSVSMAFFILNDSVVFSQWIGILLIIAAIVIMNIKWKK
ncbi:EamA family transporter [Flavobacterium haoranii]|uniref:Threonine/homoserine efflux transporter RhtA n=1 Tax=Flavobacterium haoranii TaxID=683124 RepID=A0A1M6BR00_9FLAO|nr:DMT family transporter [Flavobacterium haoranii]SHI51121.1 Threonine/homoserine efflux transporter RhtA [Flavobacterium haoranii]